MAADGRLGDGGGVVGRPIKVYDEPELDQVMDLDPTLQPSPEILKRQKMRRLPGRDISVSSSEDEDEDGQPLQEADFRELAARIQVVEDPQQKLPPPPRKSSLASHHHHQTSSSSSNTSSIDNKKISLELPTSSHEQVLLASPTLELPPARKRSVSFQSLVIDEETPVYSQESAEAIVKDTTGGSSKEGMPEGRRGNSSGEQCDELRAIEDSNTSLQVTGSHRTRHKQHIESLVRPPTPPKHFS